MTRSVHSAMSKTLPPKNASASAAPVGGAKTTVELPPAAHVGLRASTGCAQNYVAGPTHALLSSARFQDGCSAPKGAPVLRIRHLHHSPSSGNLRVHRLTGAPPGSSPA